MHSARFLSSSRFQSGAALARCRLLGACSSSPPPPTQTGAPARPRSILVGEVAIVDEAGRFVLVDLASNLYVPAPGLALRTLDSAGKTTAHLRAAAERKRPFIAADIVDGSPAVGDLVLQ
jgi:hypothetical protein